MSEQDQSHEDTLSPEAKLLATAQEVAQLRSQVLAARVGEAGMTALQTREAEEAMLRQFQDELSTPETRALDESIAENDKIRALGALSRKHFNKDFDDLDDNSVVL